MAGSRSDRQGRRAAPPPIIDLKAEEVVDATPGAPQDAEPVPPASEPDPETVTVAQEEAAGADASSPEEVRAEPEAPPASEAPRPSAEAHAGEEPEEGGRWAGRAAYAAAALVFVLTGGLLAYAFGDRLWPRGPDPDMLTLTARLDQTTASIGSVSDRLTAVERDLTVLRDAHAQLATDSDNLRKAFEEQTAADRKSLDGNDSRIAEVERRQTEMQATIGNMRSSLETAGDSGASALVTGELKNSFDALAARLAETEKRLAAATTELEAMKQSQAQASQDQARADSGAAAIGQAVTALAGKVRQGQPFAAELDAVAKLAPGTPALDVLRLNATSGVQSPAALSAKLSDLEPALAGASGKAEAAEAPGLWSRFTARISSLVKVRRLDEADWPATIAKARSAFAADDIDAAIGAVEAAAPTPPPQVAEWLKLARASRDVEAALRQVETAALARFGSQP